MSYDVDVGPEDFNYTSNVAALFYEHIPAELSCGGLHEINGLTGKQASIILSRAFDSMHRVYLAGWSDGAVGATNFTGKYDAPNGWGSTVGGMIFLGCILRACIERPRAIVRVSA